MSHNNNRKLIYLLAVMIFCAAGFALAQTTKVSGTVESVDGNNLIVKMDTGDVQVFTPPADRKFIIDGKELTLAELQPGTHLTATVTKTSTTVTERTVESLEGTVLWRGGNSVVLKLASGESKSYTVKHTDPVKMTDQNGNPITVFDLKKGMNIKATKITETPREELVADVQVTGTAPKAAAPAQAAQATTPSTMEAKSAEAPKMPKTGSSLPLYGEIGILFICVAFAIRRLLV